MNTLTVISDFDQEDFESKSSKEEIFFQKRILIHCHPANMVRILPLLQGRAESIFLSPFEICDDFVKRVSEYLSFDYVVEDKFVQSKNWRGEKKIIEGLTISGFRNDVATRWILTTSGTTGTPKIVSHDFASLARTVSKKNKYIWGLLYDPSKFAGIQVVLQAWLSGAKIIVPSPNESFERKVEFLVKNNCTALSATPSLWRKILMTKAGGNLNLEQITIGGEVVDDQLLNVLKNKFPSSRIVHIYASTEAGVGFAVNDGKAGFPSAWLREGYRDLKLSVSDEGKLLIFNLMRSQKYIGTDEEIAVQDGWIDTGDLVEIIGERVFFRGRLNGSINVGGNKVSPEEVEEAIREVPGILQVVVRGRKNSITGELVEALVVIDKDMGTDDFFKRAIKDKCKKIFNNATHKIPAFILITKDLNTNPSGKVVR
ncbi:AMP-binding protein [Comamonas aquatica]|uniref:AMP-binding protein n=1 Tax=Comamonas aquatica TaxID=225991 RepID=UPI0021B09B2B|nr:class I adenylate-forming enzyme family protein [Comamonas aquatica]